MGGGPRRFRVHRGQRRVLRNEDRRDGSERWSAVVRSGPRVNLVQAPKESLRDPLILEYKSTRGKAMAIRNTPLSGSRPGGGFGTALLCRSSCSFSPENYNLNKKAL